LIWATIYGGVAKIKLILAAKGGKLLQRKVVKKK
jgi:hypothetical protein